MPTDAGTIAAAPPLLLNLFWALIVGAMIVSRIERVRALGAIAAGCALWWAIRAGVSWPWIAWPAMLLLACLAQLALLLLARHGGRFTAEERGLIAAFRLAPGRARHLIDQGFWLDGSPGDILTREGEPVSHLYWLATGSARVISDGREVARCRPGNFVGEVTVLTEDDATGTVMVEEPSRLWCAPSRRLRGYADLHGDVRSALEAAFRRSLTEKLVASNRAIAELSAPE